MILQTTNQGLMALSLVILTVPLVLLMSGAEATPGPLPAFSCDTMLPSKNKAEPQKSGSPYLLRVPKAPVGSGSDVPVVLMGKDPTTTFTGFFVMAFEHDTGNLAGSFAQAPKTVDCEGSATAAQHAASTDKARVALTWACPPGFSGNVTFVATVVQRRDTFWTDIFSNQLVVV
ncbi:putative defense protein 3 [Oratosquilla oratoria]|uniref:putative defense protein 3 n=1 Tax=Oratosquilla oratoria TaxID=337810 RepID=UPI003F759801